MSDARLATRRLPDGVVATPAWGTVLRADGTPRERYLLTWTHSERTGPPNLVLGMNPSGASETDVFFAPAGRHSEKPECFQDALDEMFPEGNRLEMFARRERAGEPFTRDWLCVGNECPSTEGEDIRDSLKRLMEMGS